MKEATQRILIAIIGIPIFLFAIWYGKIFFALLITLIALFGVFEFYAMAEMKQMQPQQWLGFLTTIGVAAGMYWEAPAVVLFVLMLSVMVSLGIALFSLNERPIMNTAVTLFGPLYIGVFFTSLIGIREFGLFASYGSMGHFVILLFVGVWMCDTSAYFLGTLFGKHKLSPRVSPNKSVEGAVAGLLGAVLVLLIVYFSPWLPTLTLGMALLLAVVIGIFGQIGDLMESWLKRTAEIKDSSHIIPGHGGVLDRFDSMLIVAPVTYLLCQMHIF